MAIGLGIVLLVAGAILAFGVVEADIDFIDDGALGGILLVAGILAIVLSLVINAQRRRTVVEDRPAVVERRDVV
jgi:hypothetical protein